MCTCCIRLSASPSSLRLRTDADSEFLHVEHGVSYSAIRQLDDGREVDRISTWLMPNIMSVPDIVTRRPVIRHRLGRTGATRITSGFRDHADSPAGTVALGRDSMATTWAQMTEEEQQDRRAIMKRRRDRGRSHCTRRSIWSRATEASPCSGGPLNVKSKRWRMAATRWASASIRTRISCTFDPAISTRRRRRPSSFASPGE